MKADENVLNQTLNIHPTSAVHPAATIGEGATVGPFCMIGPDVVIGRDCVIHNHVTIVGDTTIGDRCEIYPQAIIGAIPQDMKYRGEKTRLVIGDDNIFREQCTAHPGTAGGGGVTRVGNGNLFMAGVHIGHDVIISDHCILANLCLLAGHVLLEDYVVIGGHVGIHHFVTVGRYAMVAGMTKITADVPPFMTVAGTRTARQEVRMVNGVGLKRRNFTEEQIRNLKNAYMRLFSRRARSAGVPMIQAIERLKCENPDENVLYLCEFLLRSFECGRKGRYLESLRTDQVPR